jgi:oligopeptide/dipeptide ABC transporter ATP-binding protein
MLEVRNLSVSFKMGETFVPVTRDVEFSLEAGATLGIVGESGSGKSVTSLAIMGLLPKRGARVEADRLAFAGRDLLTLKPEEWRALRGKDVAMIFQDPMTSLNPLMKCGEQIAEAIRHHQGKGRAEARTQSVELLARMGIADPERGFRAFPFELSGGMRQRVMIAMALSCRPKLLIADEPTTALDVTVEKQILELMMKMKDELGLSIIMITHNLPVALNYCDRILVMYAGKAMEAGTALQLVSHPAHPYTRALFSSNLEIGKRGTRVESIKGNIPPLTQLPSGCRFHPRCPLATDKCRSEEPLLKQLANGSEAAGEIARHLVSCHYPLEAAK